MTLRGARLLALADVVLHDALMTAEMLELCPQAIKIAVGKRCGQLSTAQSFINKQLIDQARKHAAAVRLKGGDPMLFGRADEELRALEMAGIAVEVVPGIATALAAAAAAKQPLTRRDVARSVAFFTSSTTPLSPPLTPGTSLAPHHNHPDADTLVQYMGGRQAIATAQRLLANGRQSTTPVLIVENCSRPDQRIMRIDLAQLAHGLGDIDGTSGPVLVMLGEAMAARELQLPGKQPSVHNHQTKRA